MTGPLDTARHCHWHECSAAPVVRIHFGSGVHRTSDYCPEHAALIRDRANKPGSVLGGVEHEEPLDPQAEVTRST